MSEAMSIATSNSDQTTFNGQATPLATLATDLLSSLSEAITAVTNIDPQQNNFLEFGCYLYRVTPAIVELKLLEYPPKNAIEILQSLYNNLQQAKDILRKYQQVKDKTLKQDLGATVKELEGVIKLVGENLSLLPTSTFREQDYAEIAVRSLSEEMKKAHFEATKPGTEKFSREFSIGSSHSPSSPRQIQVLRSISTLSEESGGPMSPRSIKTMQEAAHYVEPIFKSFVCPLTKEIMNDPVTIQSGVTYERQAINEWFERFGEADEITCPVTGQKLITRIVSPNLALKAIIEEWKDRNETAKIKVIRAALSSATSESMILDALNDLHNICERRVDKRKEICNLGMIHLLVKLLEFRDRKVRCSSLNILQLLAQDDDGKELIGKTGAITSTVRMLSSGNQPVRHAALSLLLELSKSKFLSEKIGWVTGGILMLIKIKFDRGVDAFASETAEQIVKNLAQCLYNIKCMAENGFVDPLIDNLTEGTDEMKLKMANYLGEIVLGHNNSSHVAERASPVLIQMICSGNAMNRKAALKALAQISSNSINGSILVETGVVKTMVEEIFIKQSSSEAMDTLEEAAITLANILETGIELEDLKVNSEDQEFASSYAVFNIVYKMMNSNSDGVNISLIRILSCLAKSPKLTTAVLTAVKESDASSRLVTFINHHNEELQISAIRLLIILSSHIGHVLAERISKSNGLLESLLQIPSDIMHITERHALSAKLLAELPYQNITLNFALLEVNAVPTITQMINQIQKSGTRPSRYAGAYMESIVGILVRFTATMYEPQILSLAMNYRFTELFTGLLMETSGDDVKRLAATGLEKLSTQTIILSKPPTNVKKKTTTFCCISSVSEEKSKVPVCAVHRGVCSAQKTFCLIEGKSVEDLLMCLDHHNGEVVEASLSALSTLLDEKVDVNRSVFFLNKLNATERVIKVVRDHKKESLLQKVFWMVESFLKEGGDGSAFVVAQDRMFSATVVTAFHHGDPYTRQLAEKILRYLNKMPMHTMTFTSNSVS